MFGGVLGIVSRFPVMCTEFRRSVWNLDADIGIRTIIIAIKISDYEDPSWFNGPPYAVVEHVFDGYDLLGCQPV